MTYAIGYLMYGVDITPHEYGPAPFVQHFQDEDTKYAYEDDEEAVGVHTAYSGSGFMPVWLGVNLATIDECQTVVLKDLLEDLPSQEELDKQWKKYLEEDLDPDARQAIEKVHGELKPTLLIIWGSS